MHDDLLTTNGAWRSVDGRFWEFPSRREHSTGIAAVVPATFDRFSQDISFLMKRAANGDPAVALQAVRTLRRRVLEVERDAVAIARTAGWSWRDVGEALGLSRSAVHRRHAR